MIGELICWLVLFIVFVLAEVFTVQMVSVWFACGSFVAFIATLFHAPLWLEIVLFIVASVLLLVFTRPLARKLLKQKPVPTNADSLIGKQGVVIEPIDALSDSGRIHIEGLDWSAKSADGSVIEKDAVVVVERIEGVKVIVKQA